MRVHIRQASSLGERIVLDGTPRAPRAALRVLTAPSGHRSHRGAPCGRASGSLATDHSGRAALCSRLRRSAEPRRYAPRTRRSGRLVSTPAPSGLSVASPCGRRTRNRLACWPLAPGRSARAAGCASAEVLSLAPGQAGRGREREQQTSVQLVRERAAAGESWCRKKTPSERLQSNSNVEYERE